MQSTYHRLNIIIFATCREGLYRNAHVNTKRPSTAVGRVGLRGSDLSVSVLSFKVYGRSHTHVELYDVHKVAYRGYVRRISVGGQA